MNGDVTPVFSSADLLPRCHASVFVGGSLDSCSFWVCHASVFVCGSPLIVVIFGFEFLCVSWIDLGRRRLFLREDHASRVRNQSHFGSAFLSSFLSCLLPWLKMMDYQGQAKIHRLPQIALSDVIKLVINKSL
jgi:hypothetical protein